MTNAQSRVSSRFPPPLDKLLAGGAGGGRGNVLLAALVVLVLARNRLLGSDEGGAKTPKSTGLTPLPTPFLQKAQMEGYIPNPDGTRDLLVPHRGRISKVRIRPTKASTYAAHRAHFPLASSASGTVGVNADFIRQLRALLRIIIPRWNSKEAGMVALHSAFLVLRTVLSLIVARLDGKIVRDLVSANGKGFLQGLAYWFLLAIPSTYTNAMIRFLQSKLSLAFRTRLTRYVDDLYLSPNSPNYYKLLNLGVVGPPAKTRPDEAGGAAEVGGGGADQFITSDLASFCDTLSSLYSNVSKPLLDLIIFNVQLASSLGTKGVVGLFANYFVTAYILKSLSPAFGKLSAVQARLEGEFRAAHARLIANSEEVAFYNGSGREYGILRGAYLRLIKHCNAIFKIRIAYSMTEDFVIKYAWSAAGYCLISIPVLLNPKIRAKAQALAHAQKASADGVDAEGMDEKDVGAVAERTEDYIANRRLLLALADAGGRLLYSFKEISELAGYTSRVYSLISTLHALDTNSYPAVERPSDISENDDSWYQMTTVRGRVNANAGHIKIQDVPVVAPPGGLAAQRGGEELIRALSLEVKKGEHVLITGSNGVGKTGVARILARLWPAWKGSLDVPESIMFMPQRPYLSIGSLRDQVIYPHAYPQMAAAGKTDDDLLEILERVHLAYLPSREGGWDTIKEWKDVLSGGEKQRINMARMLYHVPSFAVLDECTSAVSTDVEGLMYEAAKDLGITLITISHRLTLAKYHARLLRLTDDGDFELQTIGGAEQRMSVDAEIAAIEEKLAKVDGWKKRLEEVRGELGV